MVDVVTQHCWKRGKTPTLRPHCSSERLQHPCYSRRLPEQFLDLSNIVNCDSTMTSRPKVRSSRSTVTAMEIVLDLDLSPVPRLWTPVVLRQLLEENGLLLSPLRRLNAPRNEATTAGDIFLFERNLTVCALDGQICQARRGYVPLTSPFLYFYSASRRKSRLVLHFVYRTR
jgi:hypothetical protein